MFDMLFFICYSHIEFYRYEDELLIVHYGNSKVFMAFSDITRLKILELLRLGEKSATVLREKIGAGQSTLSHHMRILVDSKIVNSRKEGKWTFYSISESGGHYAQGLLQYLTSMVKPADAGISNINNIKINGKSDAKSVKLPEIISEQRRTEKLKPFTIVVDTSCDLSPEYIKEHDIQVMAIPFLLDNIEHSGGYWQEITGSEFYNSLRNGSIAKTSSVNPSTYIEAFTGYAEQGKEAVYIILSGNLSATFQNSQIALADVRNVYPDCKIYTIDSVSATAVCTLLTMMAVDKRNEGLSAEETANWLNEKKHHLFGVFTVDDLMYLHRGGRLSILSAVGGSLLGIKPLLMINPDGSLGLKEKVRGRDAALKALISTLEKSVSPGTVIEKLLIPHSDCEDDAKKLAGMVKEKFEVKHLEIVLIGPVIGAHVGPGTVALVYESYMTREQFENKYS